jgi:hypothetical protein
MKLTDRERETIIAALTRMLFIQSLDPNPDWLNCFEIYELCDRLNKEAS